MVVARLFASIVLAFAAFVASNARAQEVPLAVTGAAVFRLVTGDNLLGQYDPGDVLRFEVFVTRSMKPTTVIATHGDVRLELSFYSGPMLDDLYQGTIPFDPTLAGPWEINVTRGGRATTAMVGGVPPGLIMPLIEDIHVETVDSMARLAWTWPDLSALRAAGLMVVGDIRAMQEDNHAQYQLNFGFTREPMAIGNAGDLYSVGIPGGLESDKLFLFRVYLTAYDRGGNVVAQSVSFATRLYAEPAG